MTLRIESIAPDRAIDAYNCQPDTPELIEYKKQSAGFLGDKIRQEHWIAYALYHEDKPVGKAILIPTGSGMTWIEGEGVYFFHCLNLQKAFRQKGWGRQFLTRIIEDLRKQDVKALAVTCFADYWMSFSFFKHMGFEEVMHNDLASLMVKRFHRDTQIYLSPKTPQFNSVDNKVRVDIVYDLTCPFMTANYSNHKEIAESFSPHILVHEHYIRMACDYSAVGDAGFYIEGEDIASGPVDELLLKRKLREHLQKKGLEP